ncbi:MAG TPA: hypothetical protein PKA33_21355 [Amaricoccus sp.]|uniref:hypothetical protein n=2 Tax=Amaricoccus sp. TaxID=1872485 RepID=UPI002CD39C26|nr:hypothetical protein [Amaricoccus sp.]HMQ95236.1 hypothetical protein [Amaricoccus sp.]HMU01876.1 hypothetical protein [Amaricoccus sp.]
MSMRISDRPRAAALLIAGLALAACEGLPGAGGPSRATVSVAGEPIVIAGPPGFCIDRETLNVSDFGAFALMSDCALLAGGDRSGVISGAALTASISSGGLGGEGDDPVQSLADLAAFAQTGEGRAMLGRSGSANGVRILATQQRGEVLFVLVEDRGPQPIAGVDRRFWRAFLEVKDRMAVLSVLGFEDAGLDPQAGLDLLAAFVAALQRANPA